MDYRATRKIAVHKTLFQMKAREQFAKANGWKYTPRDFPLFTLAAGKKHAGNYYSGFNFGAPDHAEYFRKDGITIAITGHEYRQETPGEVREFDWYGQRLVRHVAPAGKSASWYYPERTTLIVITRPDTEIVWPTDAQMWEFRAWNEEHENLLKEYGLLKTHNAA